MIKQTKLIPFLLLAILFSLQLRATAIEPIVFDIPRDRVLISNRSNQPVGFWLRNGDSTWFPFQLEGGESKLYKNLDQIWISTTGQEPVHYKLAPGQRYMIVWDSTNQRWDIRKMPGRY